MTTKRISHLAIMLLLTAMPLPAIAQAVGAKAPDGAAAAVSKAPALTTAQMQQRQLQTIRQFLGSNDDEFAVLSPKISRILTLKQQANLPGSGAGRRVGGTGLTPTQNPDGSPLPPVLLARAELQNTIQDQNAPPELIIQKLEAYRTALAKAKEELSAAQKDLISVLTPRQESLLVLNEVLN